MQHPTIADVRLLKQTNGSCFVLCIARSLQNRFLFYPFFFYLVFVAAETNITILAADTLFLLGMLLV